MRFTMPVLALLLIVMPVASAHISHPPSSVVLELDGFKVAVTPTPSPVTINTPTVFILVDVEEDPNNRLPGATIRFTTEPNATLDQREFHQNGTVWETSPILFNTTGMLSANVILQPDNESEGRFSFRIYRPLPFDFAPIDATSDPTATVPYSLTFRTVDRSSGRPQDVLTDLRAMLFPAGTSPENGDRFENITFSKNGTGEWNAIVNFESSGTWLIQLNSGSGGFHNMDVAPWQVDVLQASDTKDSPDAGLIGFTAAVLVAAALVMRAPPRRAR